MKKHWIPRHGMLKPAPVLGCSLTGYCITDPVNPVYPVTYHHKVYPFYNRYHYFQQYHYLFSK